MIWRKETSHLYVSDQGYKIGMYRVSGETYYRPSLKGDFIARPFTDLDAAKAECDRHFEGGVKA
ncbi:MAG: hypothetical protein J6D44_14680 [Pseudomonas sp.]|nr:hypothetical protein [Pseudomonas sp.]